MTNSSENELNDESHPRVGIFWAHGGEVLSETTTLEAGITDGRFINAPFDHVSSWPAIQRRHRQGREALAAQFRAHPEYRALRIDEDDF